MNKRYIDFVPAKTATKKSSKIVSSTPVKPVENYSVRSTTTVRTTTITKPLTAAPKKPATPPKPTKSPIPTPRFVNTEKINKRPLSGSIAPVKPTILTPTAIISSDKKSKKSLKRKAKNSEDLDEFIDQPDRNSAASIIVIIVTIILGALAGAFAFFILPK